MAARASRNPQPFQLRCRRSYSGGWLLPALHFKRAAVMIQPSNSITVGSGMNGVRQFNHQTMTLLPAAQECPVMNNREEQQRAMTKFKGNLSPTTAARHRQDQVDHIGAIFETPDSNRLMGRRVWLEQRQPGMTAAHRARCTADRRSLQPVRNRRGQILGVPATERAAG